MHYLSQLKPEYLEGKTVFLRADLNVPLKEGSVQDDFRIQSILPTLHFLLEKKTRIVLASHLGRPKGAPDPTYSLKPIVQVLCHLLPQVPIKGPSFIGEERKTALETLKCGEILILENLRFYPGEENNDPAFAQELAQGCHLYVNDAFACSHRAHASVDAITHYLPAYAGLTLEQEILSLNKYISQAKRPFWGLVGGAKVSTKLDLLMSLLEKVDGLLIGGGMANTFLLSQGFKMGQSLAEPSLCHKAQDIIKKAAYFKKELVLPLDVIVTESIYPQAPFQIRAIDSIQDSDIIVDMGPKTIALYQEKIKHIHTLILNGAMGVAEVPPFDTGTTQLARFVADQTKKDALISIAGGGDTASDLKRAGVFGELSYLSTAGGAFLEWVEGKTLPGLKALEWTMIPGE